MDAEQPELISPVTPEMVKPAVLYHASSNRHIAEFEPRAESIRDPLEEPVVFATPDAAYASMFIVPSTDVTNKKGRFTDETGAHPWHCIIGDKDDFLARDNGGTIYELDPAAFTTDPKRNMPGIEWTAKTNVVPRRQIDYPTGVHAMQAHGVNVYFVDMATLGAMKAAEDHGYAIIQTLTPEPLAR